MYTAGDYSRRKKPSLKVFSLAVAFPRDDVVSTALPSEHLRPTRAIALYILLTPGVIGHLHLTFL
jgi:hypothetical protein